MADGTLATRTAAGTLDGTELYYTVQGGADRKATGAQIKALAVGAGSVSVASGKTATVSNSITLAGTDATTMTFPPASASVGYLGLPINGQNAGYTCVLSDSGKAILMQTAGTFTIPANSPVPYQVGTAITFINGTTSSSIAITSDTMTLAGSSTVGTRSLVANGMATAIKLTSTTWIISGTGLT
jgi:hypothetical protein